MSGKHIVILASGGGSNAQCIIEYLHQHTDHIVSAVFSNNQSAGVLSKADKAGVKAQYHQGSELPTKLIEFCSEHQVDAIVLAGYLRLIPKALLEVFPNHIINIHPALLPKYGGKGMYGMHVHIAVLEAKEEFSGMTIHLVNEVYDKGEILSQAKVNVKDCKSAAEVASRVLTLEHFHYPRVIRSWLDGLKPPV